MRPLGALLLAGLAACAPGAPRAPGVPAPAQRRAILASFDSFNEARIVASLPEGVIPSVRALFADATCAATARPPFPSVTAAGHASLWTGAYGDVSGIAANTQPRLPQDAHTLLDRESGYAAAALRAEPIWITAGRAGLAVVGHHPTQAPDVPGFRPVSGAPTAELEARRADAAAVLARPNVRVLNGYNRSISRDTLLDERAVPPRPAAGWSGLERLGPMRHPPREIAWTVGADSIFALLYGHDAYTHVLVARARDAAAGVVAAAAPVERAPGAGRPLARHFSEALELPLPDGGRAYLRVRLFALAPDASSFLLFQPELHVVQANRPAEASAYDAAVRGFVGNGATALLTAGALGKTLEQGGDGTAEARYVETAELVTRQFMRGTDWLWRTYGPALLLDYFPLADEVDHLYYGWVVPDGPPRDSALVARLQAVRERVWALVDLRMAQLRALAGRDRGTALFVSGDHGMRATWRVFRPNAALRNVGLLSLDTAGQVDLARTRALSPNGYWVSINRAAWKGGIVPPEEEATVLAAAERALLAARAPDRAPVVTRVWRAAEHDSLGIGGPVGGDLYFSLAPGYAFSAMPLGAVASDTPPDAEHGYASVEPDMHTVFCAAGAAFPPRRVPQARTIDVAPTVSAWLGIPAPADSRGRVVF